MRKPIALFLVLLISLFLVSAKAETTSVFGEIQAFDIINRVTAKVIGERAVVTADKDLMTNDNLINFHKAHIKDSGYKWFVIDFGDGTGYSFGGSSYLFTYLYQHEEDWSQSDPRMEIGMGYVFEDSVEFILAIEIPELSTIDEYRKWAKQNGVDFRLLNENFKEVKKGKEIVDIWEKFIIYPGDTLTIIVK